MDNYFENTDNIILPQNKVVVQKGDLYKILDKCALIKNNVARARAYVNLLSAEGAKKILENYEIETDTKFGLQESPSIVSKWDIAEVFIGLYRISVRPVFADYKPFIPKKHEKYGLFPNMFMFVYIEENKVKLLGFLPQEKLNKTNSDDENYYVELDELQSLDDIKKCFDFKHTIENINQMKKERIKIIQFLEGNIDDKIAFFKLLANSRFLREELIKFEQAEDYYNQLVEKEDEVKREIEKDIVNISRLADAFIQSKEEILKTSEVKLENAEHFKLDCARANLEKLFNSSPTSEVMMDTISNSSSEDVMETILTQSDYAKEEKILPVSAVLRAFQVIVSLILTILIVLGFLCYMNYTQTTPSDIWISLKKRVYYAKTVIIKYVELFQ